MSNILLLVEGPTERRFTNEILNNHFSEIQFHAIELLGGGYHSFSKTAKEINAQIKSFNHCTKFFLVYDYYGLHPTFKDDIDNNWSLDKKITYIRDKFTKEIHSDKFYFYIQVHEFEALLFSDINKIESHFEDNKLKKLGDILNKAKNNPELINDSTETAPYKRLKTLFPNFGKTTDGIVILKNIGIQKLREKCNYFDIFCKEIEK